MKFISLFVLLLLACSLKAQDVKPVIESKEIKDSSYTGRYTIEASYVQISGLNSTVEQNINRILKDSLDRVVKSFRDDFIASAEEMNKMKDGPSADVGSFLEVGDTAVFNDDGLLSVIRSHFFYYLGAAHPNRFTYTFNFSTTSGNIIKLSDMFTGNYIQAISDYAVKEIKKQYIERGAGEPDTEMLMDGAGTKEENFSSFNITSEGLLIAFDPYQVAPYALGDFAVTIPYSTLSSYIKKDGVLGSMQY